MIATESICPVCYAVIPAILHIGDTVIMEKHCVLHGKFTSMVERDPVWFSFCRELGCKGLYNGYILDITDRCNIQCKYCYHDKSTLDKSVEEIIEEAKSVKHLAPFILSGGEPTLHPEFPKIIKELSKFGETTFLTNGTRVCEPEYLDSLIDVGILTGTTLRIGLSLHKEAEGKDIKFLQLCKERGYTIISALVVVDSLTQIDEVLDIYKEFKDVILAMRIKAATSVWNENKPQETIFVSDMLAYLERLGRVDILTEEYNNKVSFSHVSYEGMHLILGSWYNVNNIDLVDNMHPPWYKAKDGNVYSLTTAFMVNERLSKGIDYEN